LRKFESWQSAGLNPEPDSIQQNQHKVYLLISVFFISSFESKQSSMRSRATVFIDSYGKGWALRYLREARAELLTAKTDPKIASRSIFNAMKKAQAAIYHSLGDPALIEEMVQQKVPEENFTEEPIVKCLVEIERSIQQVASLRDLSIGRSIRTAENIVRTASEIVNLFVEES